MRDEGVWLGLAGQGTRLGYSRIIDGDTRILSLAWPFDWAPGLLRLDTGLDCSTVPTRFDMGVGTLNICISSISLLTFWINPSLTAVYF